MASGSVPVGGSLAGRLRDGLVSFVRRVDLPLALCTLALVAYGLVVVYSASLSIADASAPRQAVGAAAGLMMQPQKKRANGIVADAVRTVSDVTDTIRDTMGW